MLHNDPSLPPPLTACLQTQEAARLLPITVTDYTDRILCEWKSRVFLLTGAAPATWVAVQRIYATSHINGLVFDTAEDDH